MAYTIIRSNGAVLTTIPDGNINSTSTPLQLPGRNYPGYGQALDTNFVRIVENFANSAPPQHALKGQLWYNTTLNTLNICPTDGSTNTADWSVVATTTTGGSSTLGNLTVTGNISANNVTVSEDITCNSITGTTAMFSSNIIVATANVTTGNIGAVRTTTITTGGSTTTGGITGVWTVTGSTTGNALAIAQGNVTFASAAYGVRCDNYMYANGQPFNPSGTYTNGNVGDYLTGANSTISFFADRGTSANLQVNKLTASTITGGGNIGGIWTLDAGARIQATYADLAERFESDAVYDTGTVVEIGGEKEITQVQDDLSEEVFGVVSTASAFTMNGVAGTDLTHPAIAVSGRVPVKVIGKVKKGQRLVSAGHGYARAAKRDEMTAFNVIGRALENKTTPEAGIVLAVVAITK